MATCQVWRLATVAGPWARWVAAVAMAPQARRRSVRAPSGSTSWASKAQAEAVGRTPFAGVRATPTRMWVEPGAAWETGGAAVSRCSRNQHELLTKPTYQHVCVCVCVCNL